MSWLLIATGLSLLVVQPASSSSFVANERRQLSQTPSQLGKKFFHGTTARRPTDDAVGDDGGDASRTDPGEHRDRQIASYVAAILSEDIRQLIATLRCRFDQRPDYENPDPIGLLYWMMRSSNGDVTGGSRRSTSPNGIVVDTSVVQPPRQVRSSSRYASQMDEVARTLGASGLYAPEVDDGESNGGASVDDEGDSGNRSQNRQQGRGETRINAIH